MRTTVDIHEQILARAKAHAAATGRRLSDVVNDALLEHFDRLEAAGGSSAAPVMLPVSEGRGGFRSGIDPRSNASMLDAIDGYDGEDLGRWVGASGRVAGRAGHGLRVSSRDTGSGLRPIPGARVA